MRLCRICTSYFRGGTTVVETLLICGVHSVQRTTHSMQPFQMFVCALHVLTILYPIFFFNFGDFLRTSNICEAPILTERARSPSKL
jgi:hypothetical protein